MSPFALSKAMREGTLNEPNVLSRIGDFLDRESSFRIKCIREYGLACARGMFYAAFSPDAIVLVEDEEEFMRNDGSIGQRPPRLFVVEIKSKCTASTVKKEINMSIRYGVFRTVFVDLTDGEGEFKQLVPELDYRCQLLHCIACAGLRHAFYVVASLQKIIRIVHVHVHGDAIEQYRLALQEVHNRELSWVLHGKLPSLDGMKLGHAVDVYTVTKALDLWRCINNAVAIQGQPLPPGRMLIPTIIAMWNRNKGPIDVFSRFMKNCHARHAQLSPIGNIWLRLLMSRVYNAYQSYVLSRSASFLLSDDCLGYASFKANR
jgi:hypothetical protein